MPLSALSRLSPRGSGPWAEILGVLSFRHKTFVPEKWEASAVVVFAGRGGSLGD